MNELEQRLSPYIEEKWLKFLVPFFNAHPEIFKTLSERKTKCKIVPEQKDMFNVFKYTPFDNVKVVIIADTPYNELINGKIKANGLAYSLDNSLYISKSLQKIRGEIEDEIAQGQPINFNTNLEHWAKQGILLLNTSLTAELNWKEAHIYLWKPFTEHVIKTLNEYSSGVIYCLWGKNSEQYRHLINKNNYILEDKYFSRINEILKENNKDKIEWI